MCSLSNIIASWVLPSCGVAVKALICLCYSVNSNYRWAPVLTIWIKTDTVEVGHWRDYSFTKCAFVFIFHIDFCIHSRRDMESQTGNMGFTHNSLHSSCPVCKWWSCKGKIYSHVHPISCQNSGQWGPCRLQNKQSSIYFYSLIKFPTQLSCHAKESLLLHWRGFRFVKSRLALWRHSFKSVSMEHQRAIQNFKVHQ